MPEDHDTVIIGAGQAGLTLSRLLSQRGSEHVLLDRAEALGHSWRNERWDSFTLVTPNHSLRLPGFPYSGGDPHGYIGRDDIVRYLESFAATFSPPVRLGVELTALDADPSGKGFVLETSGGPMRTRKVVIASGTFAVPVIPASAASLPHSILHLPSSRYRNAEALPPGGVLVVGSGQTGVQIADDLRRGGRQVWLSTGRTKRIPRRYRGRDMFDWLETIGFFQQTFADAPEPKSRLEASPQMSGYGGGRTIDLHQFASEGINLLGRFQQIEGATAYFAPDHHDNVRFGDAFSGSVCARLDGMIAAKGVDAPYGPDDQLPPRTEAFAQPQRESIDLVKEGISTIVWSAGFRFDWRWLRLPVIDGDGYPIQERGISPIPGLSFLGQHWLHTRASALFSGVGQDAQYLIESGAV